MRANYKLVASLLLVTMLAGCGAAAEPEATPLRDPVAVKVQTIADSHVLRTTLRYPGVVVSEQDVKVIAKSGGTIAELSFKVGDSVTTNQALGKIDPGANPVATSYNTALTARQNAERNLQNIDQITAEQVKQATLALEQAKTSFDLAQKNYQHLMESTTKDLKQAEIAKNQASQGAKNLDITTSESVKSARLALSAAQLALEQAKINLDNKQVTAAQSANDTDTNARNAADSVASLSRTMIDALHTMLGLDDKLHVSYVGALGALDQETYHAAKRAYDAAVKASEAYQPVQYQTTVELIRATITFVKQTKELVDASRLLLEKSVDSATLPAVSTTGGPSLSSFKTTVATYQNQINTALSQITGAEQGLINIELSNKTQLDNLQKAYELAKEQADIAAQSLNNLLAGNTSQKDQASFGVAAAATQYESTKIKLNQQLDAAATQLDLARLQKENAQVGLATARRSRQSQLDGARTQLDAIRGQTDLATIQFDNLTLSTPIAGKVTQKLVAVGETVAAGQTVAVVSQTNAVKIQTYVDQKYLSFIQVGQAVTFSDNNAQSFSGAIFSIAPQADTTTRRFLVEIRPEANNLNLPIPGVFVDVSLPVEQRPVTEGAIFMPLSAVSIGQNEKSIYVVQEQKAVRVPIEVAQVNGEYVELVLDLPSTTELIIDGNKLVKEGDTVRTSSGSLL